MNPDAPPTAIETLFSMCFSSSTALKRDFTLPWELSVAHRQMNLFFFFQYEFGEIDWVG
jgi:hypothetical protein